MVVNSAIVWPPELCLHPALLLPDLARARAIGASLPTGARPWFASPAQPAPVLAAALQAARVARVQLAGTPADVAVVDALACELARLGIGVAEAVGVGISSEDDRVPFAIAAERTADTPACVFTEAADGVLHRPAAMPTQGLPDGVQTLHFHRTATLPRDSVGVLHALRITDEADVEDLAATASALVASNGAARLRLCIEAPVSRFGTRALAALAVPALRSRLLAVVDCALPALLPLLQTACHWCDLGLDPLLQCWAGNGIAERNRDLVVNIAP